MSIGTLLIFCVSMILAWGQEMVDYTFTDYIKRASVNSKKKYDIDLKPNASKQDYLLFPWACDVDKYMYTSTLVEANYLKLADEEKLLD